MQTTLATTALLMGLVGGPHCIAMCGAACAGIGQAAGERGTSAMWTFQLGRVLGYAGLGALAAASMQGLGWLTVQSSALRPVWSMFHVGMIVLGLLLMPVNAYWVTVAEVRWYSLDGSCLPLFITPVFILFCLAVLNLVLNLILLLVKNGNYF